jgi:shikimate kinase / 3-dehydroquinate synthase
MQKKSYRFSSKEVNFYFDADFSYLEKLADKENTIIITDENISVSHTRKLKGWKKIVIQSGEVFKTQATVDSIIGQLIQLDTDRKTLLVGVGGGVITDLTGFVASVYMRGLRFGFVPTSLLSMVDAAIGGKNGIDVGVYKNLVGLIRQPDFLLYDVSFLKSLPKEEWINGFAEIIKHAAIKDSRLFGELEKNKLSYYQKDKTALSRLIRRNVLIKTAIVQRDEFETGERRLLNFGHTLGHAIENLYELSHGQSVAIGMVAASLLSEQFSQFKDTARIVEALHKYGLPSTTELNAKKVFDVLKMDKKKERMSMNYILLKKIGQAIVKPIAIDQLEELIRSITMAR